MTKIEELKDDMEVEAHFDPEQLRVLKMLPLDSDRLHAIAREMVQKEIKKRADAEAAKVGDVDEDEGDDCDPDECCCGCDVDTTSSGI